MSDASVASAARPLRNKRGRCGREIKVEQRAAQIKGLWVNERKDGVR